MDGQTDRSVEKQCKDWSQVSDLSGLVQDCGISIVSVLKIPQSCTKPLIYVSVPDWYLQWVSNGDIAVLH